MKITDKERQEIIEICEKYNINNYTIKDYGTVDVDGDVNLLIKNLTELPIKFGIVKGNFYCANNKITSLVGSPKELGGSFDCYDNQLTSLVGAPKEVGGYFNCNKNKLTSLFGGPEKVDGWFDCSYNQLTSLIGAPLIIKGDFYCEDNPKDKPKKLEQPLTIISGKIYNI